MRSKYCAVQPLVARDVDLAKRERATARELAQPLGRDVAEVAVGLGVDDDLPHAAALSPVA